MTNKKTLLFFGEMIERYPNGLDLAADGTYKLMNNPWVLIIIGVRYLSRASDDRIEYKGNESFKHSFIPILDTLAKVKVRLHIHAHSIHYI